MMKAVEIMGAAMAGVVHWVGWNLFDAAVYAGVMLALFAPILAIFGVVEAVRRFRRRP